MLFKRKEWTEGGEGGLIQMYEAFTFPKISCIYLVTNV